MKKVDYSIDIGKVFTRLTIVGCFMKKGKTRSRAFFNCVCNCGKNIEAYCNDVRAGKHKSCGCLHIDAISKHGHAPSKSAMTLTYKSWMAMRGRCNNPNQTGYEYYGGRGISVCTRWDDYSLFLADVGERPSQKHSIDRINNNGNYEPSNCKWSTKHEQNLNKTHNKTAWLKRKRDALGRWAS